MFVKDGSVLQFSCKRVKKNLHRVTLQQTMCTCCPVGRWLGSVSAIKWVCSDFFAHKSFVKNTSDLVFNHDHKDLLIFVVFLPSLNYGLRGINTVLDVPWNDSDY